MQDFTACHIQCFPGVAWRRAHLQGCGCVRRGVLVPVLVMGLHSIIGGVRACDWDACFLAGFLVVGDYARAGGCGIALGQCCSFSSHIPQYGLMLSNCSNAHIAKLLPLCHCDACCCMLYNYTVQLLMLYSCCHCVCHSVTWY